MKQLNTGDHPGQSESGCHSRSGEAGAASRDSDGRPASVVAGLPPSGNTGAVSTGCNLVDYLEVTFAVYTVEQVMAYFSPPGADLAEWSPLPSGRHGYRQGVVRGALRVYWDGSEGMGVHVVASGDGCRQLEAEGVVQAWEGPSGFAADLLARGATVSRVDVAMDDRAGLLTTERIEGAINEGRCVSRFHHADPRARRKLTDGSRGGWSVYLGSGQSRLRVRFYDKAAEQAEKGVTVEGPWMRCELQARDERGDWVLSALAGEGMVAVAGLLFNYVQFKEAGEDSNRSRWRACEWWMDFLGHVERRRCAIAAVVPTLERAANWFRKQIAPTFALLRFSAEHGDAWLDEVFASGAARLKEWQLAALAPPLPSPA